ncbi:hypothetical protein AURDEDRAFT_147243 [Auricularia subglabra TFB-10046 SS5]|uniref:N-acetyltransferase domain-containing protein n=1 Tax=Auricularia subglabra (strain TFB-10046 / SS5) TaxID=717982 RepID=J0CYB7_AURST|nr:hypothetical protein AURDEDRAFT_147243 [Auricularia subglabra TFB-10046 SS5]
MGPGAHRSIPLGDPNSLRMYSPVKLKAGKWTGHCGAYLLDDVLFFIYKDVSGSLHIHKQIQLADVEHVANRSVSNSHVVGVRTAVRIDVPQKLAFDGSVEPAEHVYANYNFSVDSGQLVVDWLASLKTQLPFMNPDHPVSPRSAAKPRPRKFKKATVESPHSPERSPIWSLAGVVFLSPSPALTSEYNVGVAILPQFSSDGLATHAIAHVLEKAFEELRAHRVQARILRTDTHDVTRAVCKFVHLGFTHEGILRRAVMHPASNCWTDVSVLSILDVEWTIRLSVNPPPQSIWDEMFNRHQREREHLLVWDGGLKRTRSMETIRDLRALLDAPTSSVLGEGDGSITSSESSAAAPATLSSGVSATNSWDALSASSDLDPVDEWVQRWADEHSVIAEDTGDLSSSSWDDVDGDEYENDDEGYSPSSHD